MKKTSEITLEFKMVTHSASILFIPLILGVFISRENTLSVTGATILFFTIYTFSLYLFAGGFEWELEEISRTRYLLFFFLSGFFWGIILYSFWYVIRRLEAKLFDIPFDIARGMLLYKANNK